MADTLQYSGTTRESVAGGSLRLVNVIDLDAVNDANVAAGNGTLAATDIIEMIAVPANTWVKQVFVKVLTASAGTALEGDVGITGADPNGFDDAVDLTAAANTITYAVQGTDAYATAQGVMVTTADTIDFVFGTVTDVTTWGKIQVVADCFLVDPQ